MSTTAIGSSPSTAPLEPLVKKLVDRLDANRDGQISTAEFGEFLTSLLRAHSAGKTAGAGGTAAGVNGLLGAMAADNTDRSRPADPPDPVDDDAFHPSTWTDNNCPYGVTFAGWSPQDHTYLTLADLGKPGKAEKYAVYHYLVTNRVQPTHDWAPAAAAALNAKYNTTVYRAIDGETLGYGNQYVHSAPNGYGMLPGTYNPQATGEFFWGWV